MSLFYGVNTIFWTTPLLIMALLKLIVPWTPWRMFCSNIILAFANLWILCNVFMIHQLNNFEVEVHGMTDLKQDWYLIIANHQSWVDILVMQQLLQGKIPFLKFFLKQELIYIPFLGLAWWALDFPFMKRYSKTTLKNKPHLKGKDIETTRKACEKFKTQPISIVNFVEGTRFTHDKSQRQGKPFEHLLRPRSGGIGYVMSMLGAQINYVLDLTFVYPGDRLTYWDFVTGKINRIIIHFDCIPVTDELRGDYINDAAFRARFQTWLTGRWKKKDQLIDQIKSNISGTNTH